MNEVRTCHTPTAISVCTVHLYNTNDCVVSSPQEEKMTNIYWGWRLSGRHTSCVAERSKSGWLTHGNFNLSGVTRSVGVSPGGGCLPFRGNAIRRGQPRGGGEGLPFRGNATRRVSPGGWEGGVCHSGVTRSREQRWYSGVNTASVWVQGVLTLKGTVSWDRLQKFWQKFTELDLTMGRGWFLNFLWASMILKCKKYIYCG